MSRLPHEWCTVSAIPETQHRAELTVQERAEHIAEWIRLTEEKQAEQPAQVEPAVRKHGHAQQPHGINAAVRELGISRAEGQRSMKIANLAPEAKQAAIETGLDNNQTVLLQAAREPPERQAEAVRAEAVIRAEAEKRLEKARKEAARHHLAASPTRGRPPTLTDDGTSVGSQ